jgi:IS605 OrfB family transposase
MAQPRTNVLLTAVFALKTPTKTKTAVLNNRLINYHTIFDEFLAYLLATSMDDLYDKENTNAIKTAISARLKANSSISNQIEQKHFSIAMKDGLVEDMAYTLSSHLELRRKYDADMAADDIKPEKKAKLSPPGVPTLPPLIDKLEDWGNRLTHFSQTTTLEDETEARDLLQSESKAGRLRPILFPRYRLADGFYLLKHKKRDSYYVFFNLYGKHSKYHHKVELSQYEVLGSKNTHKHTGTGMVFPINFGKSHQYDQFLRYLAENTTGEVDAPIIKPKTAKLVKRGDRFEAHVSFEITREKKTPLTWIGVDRGIYNLASICLVSKDGDRVIAEENISGMDLRSIQRKIENRIKDDQKRGRKIRSSTRRGEADNAVYRAANRIVSLAEKHHAQVVIENLNNLTKRNFGRGRSNFNKLLNRAQYTKLKDVLIYKLKRAGLPKPLSVFAGGTSITCPECGHYDSSNRDREDPNNMFRCQSCGYQHDADLNAARVIALKKIWRINLPKNKQSARFNELLDTDHSFSSFLKRFTGKGIS